jgi:hypothetical protein
MNTHNYVVIYVETAIDSELADIVNVLFFNGIPVSKLSDLLKSVNIENCNMLTKTRVNQYSISHNAVSSTPRHERGSNSQQLSTVRKQLFTYFIKKYLPEDTNKLECFNQPNQV